MPKKEEFFTKHKRIIQRASILLVMAVLGIVFAKYFLNDIICFILPQDLSQEATVRITPFLYSSISAIFLLFTLWVFRTTDTREQISKTEQQISKTEQQINTTQFHKAVDLVLAITTEHDKRIIDVVKRGAGITMLAQLYQRSNDDLRKSIDNITISLNLKGIKIPNINLSNMNFHNTNLQSANLRDANLLNANLRDIDLRGVDLRGTNLKGAKLQGAKLYQSIYNDATQFPDDFNTCYLYKIAPNTNLQYAKLQGADLQGAKLQCADLQGAKLQGVDFQDADLRDAGLRGADLQGADLQGADLRGAKYNKETNFSIDYYPQDDSYLPNDFEDQDSVDPLVGFNPTERGMKLVE